VFWALALLVYAPAWRAGYERDTHGWFEMVADLSAADCINLRGVGTGSLYQVTQVQLLGITALFGQSPLLWTLLMTALHGAVAAILAGILRAVLSDLGVPRANLVAVAGALLFLLLPSAAEVVVWKASTYHYLTASLAMLSTLWLARQMLLTGKPRYAILSAGLYALTVFTIELYYITPLMVASLILAYCSAGLCTGRRAAHATALFLLPMAALLVLHFWLVRLHFGSWIAHNNAGVSDALGNPAAPLGRLLAYPLDMAGFARYWPGRARATVIEALARPAVGWAIGIGVGLLLAQAVLRFRRMRPSGQGATLLAVWSVLALAPVLPYQLAGFPLVYNDRYLYLAALFAAPLLIMALLSARRLRSVLAGGYLLLAVCLTAYTVWQWRRAGELFWNLQHTYRWQASSGPVVVLNFPVHFRGIPVFSTVGPKDPTDFDDHLRIYLGKPSRVPILPVASYNMEHTWDGAHVRVLDSTGRLTVTLNQWGTWWWHGTLGATDFETPLFHVRFTDPGHEYVLEWKEAARPQNTTVLFSQGGVWKEVDFRNVGGEQW